MSDSEDRPGERIKDVQFTEDTIAVDLFDGRTITVPLFGIHACWKRRRNRGWIGRLVARGTISIWPSLDEDLSSEGLLRGAPAATFSRLR
jgi:hypothetical protein